MKKNYLQKSPFITFSSKKIFFSFIHIKSFEIIEVIGKDSQKYLNNQFTADLDILNKNKHILCGHCNYKGKLLSVLRVLKKNSKKFLYMIKKDLYNIHMKTIKKYSIFSQVCFKKKKFKLLGILDCEIKKKLLKYIFLNLPNKKKSVLFFKKDIILYIDNPIKRYLCFLSKKSFLKIKKIFHKENFVKNDNQWDALDIESNIPILNIQSSNMFFPQEVSLNKIDNSMSFKKGCFCGQEAISRIQYKGNNKKNLFFLIGKLKKKFLIPKVGDLVFLKKNNFLYKKGIVLNSLIIENNQIWIQAILNNFNLENKFYFIKRIKFFVQLKKI
ncbi:tRNA-modifying protein YgfZ [Buchnera aphidicola]|uniref:tRNA-modifying protein YgfZ n=1 Tax=Buchnera aphidicola TaxID=9 RepID=UPI0030ED7E06